MKWKTKKALVYVSACITMGLGVAELAIKRHPYHFAAPHHSWAAAQLLEADVNLPDAPLLSSVVSRLFPTVYACSKPPCNNNQSKAVPLSNCGDLDPVTLIPKCTQYTCASTSQNKVCTAKSFPSTPGCSDCLQYATDQGCTPP